MSHFLTKPFEENTHSSLVSFGCVLTTCHWHTALIQVRPDDPPPCSSKYTGTRMFHCQAIAPGLFLRIRNNLGYNHGALNSGLGVDVDGGFYQCGNWYITKLSEVSDLRTSVSFPAFGLLRDGNFSVFTPKLSKHSKMNLGNCTVGSCPIFLVLSERDTLRSVPCEAFQASKL